jgi:uncharacterized membrane protein
MFAFLPSLAFFALAPLSVSLALWLAFAAAFAIGLRAFGTTRKVRLFDATGLVLFAPLAFYTGFVDSDFGAANAALVLETGFLLAILWSMAVRRPITCEYRWLKAPHPPELAARAHILLTAIWATTYALMGGISALSVLLHRMSPGWAGILGLLLFATTLTFTWQSGVYIDKHGGDVPLIGRK